MRKVKQIVKQNASPSSQISPETAILALKTGTPGATRTHDTRFRKPLLYPPELQGQIKAILNLSWDPLSMPFQLHLLLNAHFNLFF